MIFSPISMEITFFNHNLIPCSPPNQKPSQLMKGWLILEKKLWSPLEDTQKNPNLINIALACSSEEEMDLVKLCKEYKDAFSWTCDDLETFDSSIMQHNIPLNPDARPYQQKLRKMHPSLEPSI